MVIVFEGLDTFATIWVNGVEVGTTSNMFLEHRIDIGAVLRAAPENEVIVRFAPPASRVADKQMETWPIIADPITESKRNFIRKAQFGWGWDWGPRLPTVGIWRPVRIERQHIATIADVRFETPVEKLHLALDLEREAPIRAAITPGQSCERAAWRPQFQRGDGYIADRS